MQRILAEQFSKLTAADKLMLARGLADLVSVTEGKLVCATGCSGTDLIIDALVDTFALLGETFGHSVQVLHEFSCENIGFKQEFIRAHFDPPAVFPDLAKLASATAVDAKDRDKHVTSPFFWACGIECDSISALNKARGSNFDCIGADHESRTGSTSRSCMKFIQFHKPPLFLLECVKNLQVTGKSGRSNLAILRAMANEVGYLLMDFALNSLRYGVPQRRDRSYMVGIRYQESGFSQDAEDFVLPSWVADVVRTLDALQIDMLPLADFLLLDNDPKVLMATQPQREDVDPKKLDGHKTANRKAKVEVETVDGSNVEAYKMENLAAYFCAGLQWPPVFTDAFLEKTQMRSHRQKQVLWLIEHTQGAADMLPDLTVRDLHMSHDWQADRVGCLPCIASSSALWVRGPRRPGTSSPDTIDRFLCGSELLAVQGLEHRRQNVSGFSESQLRELAGNAFNAAVIYPLLFAVIAFAPVAAASRFERGSGRTVVVNMDDDDDSGEFVSDVGRW